MSGSRGTAFGTSHVTRHLHILQGTLLLADTEARDAIDDAVGQRGQNDYDGGDEAYDDEYGGPYAELEYALFIAGTGQDGRRVLDAFAVGKQTPVLIVLALLLARLLHTVEGAGTFAGVLGTTAFDGATAHVVLADTHTITIGPGIEQTSLVPRILAPTQARQETQDDDSVQHCAKRIIPS